MYVIIQKVKNYVIILKYHPGCSHTSALLRCLPPPFSQQWDQTMGRSPRVHSADHSYTWGCHGLHSQTAQVLHLQNLTWFKI